MPSLIGATVRGAAHIRAGRSNQDSIMWAHHSAPDETNIMALSDGHGDTKCFRCHIGSALGVKALIAGAMQHFSSVSAETGEKYLRAFGSTIVEYWLDNVQRYHFLHPFTEAEKASFGNAGGPGLFRRVVLNPTVAYGATLLGAVTFGDHWIYVQLGDGDIVEVTAMGEALRPFGTDECQGGDETLSLCDPRAADLIRIAERPRDAAPPRLVMLSSDGYAKSFKSDEGFLRVASDIVTMVDSAGIFAVYGQLHDWLLEATEQGSGDDITCGLIVSTDERAGAHDKDCRGSIGTANKSMPKRMS